MRIRDLTDAALAAEISALVENASAGATGAASVATCTQGSGGLGAGFDPNGDWGIYTKPKKKKAEAAVLRRIPVNEMRYHREYPAPFFILPIDKIAFYDDPEFGPGDDGYTIDDLVDAIGRDGLQNPIMVGFSIHDMRENDDHTVCCFNGNHRLAACRKLGMTEIMCENSDADDAEPLTTAQVVALGGRLHGKQHH